MGSQSVRGCGGAVAQCAIKSGPGNRNRQQKQDRASHQNSIRKTSAIRRPLAFSASKSDTTLVNRATVAGTEIFDSGLLKCGVLKISEIWPVKITPRRSVIRKRL